MTKSSPDIEIPADISEDEPFDNVPDGEQTKSPQPLNPAGKQIDPEKKHSWDVENFKNASAQNIVMFCLLCIFIFAIIQFSWPGADGGDAMSKASDVFKLISTTALGFLFGRNSK